MAEVDALHPDIIHSVDDMEAEMNSKCSFSEGRFHVYR